MNISHVGATPSSQPHPGSPNHSNDVESVTPSSYLWIEAKDLAEKRPILTTGIITSISSFLAALTTKTTIQYLPLTFLPAIGTFFYEFFFPTKPEQSSSASESVNTEEGAIVQGKSEGQRKVA